MNLNAKPQQTHAATHGSDDPERTNNTPRIADILFGPTREPHEIAPGAVHLPAWLDLEQQRHLVTVFEQWRAGPVPLRAATLPGGHQMSVETVCLGWHWHPYRYSRHANDVNGAQVLDVPDWLDIPGVHGVKRLVGFR